MIKTGIIATINQKIKTPTNQKNIPILTNILFII